MNNTALESIISVARLHGYKAHFTLRHISEKMDKDKVSLGDTFEALDIPGEMIHLKSGETMKLKGSYVSFKSFVPILEELPEEGEADILGAENFTEEELALIIEEDETPNPGQNGQQ